MTWTEIMQVTQQSLSLGEVIFLPNGLTGFVTSSCNPLTEMHSRATQITFQSIGFYYSLDLRTQLTSKFSPSLPRTPYPGQSCGQMLDWEHQHKYQSCLELSIDILDMVFKCFSSTIKMTRRLGKLVEEITVCGILSYIG